LRESEDERERVGESESERERERVWPLLVFSCPFAVRTYVRMLVPLSLSPLPPFSFFPMGPWTPPFLDVRRCPTV
jgi:hypothetical protein